MNKKFKILFLYPNEMLQNPPPLNIAIFSALLKKEDFDVDLLDSTFFRTEDISSDKIKFIEERTHHVEK